MGVGLNPAVCMMGLPDVFSWSVELCGCLLPLSVHQQQVFFSYCTYTDGHNIPLSLCRDMPVERLSPLLLSEEPSFSHCDVPYHIHKPLLALTEDTERLTTKGSNSEGLLMNMYDVMVVGPMRGEILNSRIILLYGRAECNKSSVAENDSAALQGQKVGASHVMSGLYSSVICRQSPFWLGCKYRATELHARYKVTRHSPSQTSP